MEIIIQRIAQALGLSTTQVTHTLDLLNAGSTVPFVSRYRKEATGGLDEVKIYYMTQAGTKPPHFVIFCNDARLFHFSYQRYLENQIREVFGLQGTPVRITIRQKGDKEE